MPEVLADQIKHYFVNPNEHIQIMKISLRVKEKHTRGGPFLSEKVAFEM